MDYQRKCRMVQKSSWHLRHRMHGLNWAKAVSVIVYETAGIEY